MDRRMAIDGPCSVNNEERREFRQDLDDDEVDG